MFPTLSDKFVVNSPNFQYAHLGEKIEKFVSDYDFKAPFAFLPTSQNLIDEGCEETSLDYVKQKYPIFEKADTQNPYYDAFFGCGSGYVFRKNDIDFLVYVYDFGILAFEINKAEIALSNIVNLTPHPINYISEGGVAIYKNRGIVARCKVITTPIENSEELYGVKMVETTFGEVEGFPYSPTNYTFFIVSQVVANALPHRKDLLVPADIVRNEQGQILGCRSFQLANA